MLLLLVLTKNVSVSRMYSSVDCHAILCFISKLINKVPVIVPSRYFQNMDVFHHNRITIYRPYRVENKLATIVSVTRYRSGSIY